MPVIDGKTIAKGIRAELRERVAQLKRPPVLDVILVGNQEDSDYYVVLKQRAVEEIGGKCNIHRLSQGSTKEVLTLVGKLNDEPDGDGILVQLPLPDGLDQDLVISSIEVGKDVDGFHPLNLGWSLTGKQYFSSCGALAVLQVVDKYLSVNNPRFLLVGDSLDLIRPLAAICVGRGYPVSVIPEVSEWDRDVPFNVVVLEKGAPRSFTSDMFPNDSLVIDAGFHWQDGKTLGNVQTETFVGEQGPLLLPVPGGLGPLLITMLLANLVKAVNLHEKR